MARYTCYQALDRLHALSWKIDLEECDVIEFCQMAVRIRPEQGTINSDEDSPFQFTVIPDHKIELWTHSEYMGMKEEILSIEYTNKMDPAALYDQFIGLLFTRTCHLIINRIYTLARNNPDLLFKGYYRPEQRSWHIEHGRVVELVDQNKKILIEGISYGLSWKTRMEMGLEESLQSFWHQLITP